MVEATKRKPILSIDWDGTLHNYTSGWQGAHIIEDCGLTEGAVTFLREASKHFTIAIFSSRSHQTGGIDAMKTYLARFMLGDDRKVFDAIEWPTTKPPAFLTIDDRAITFTGKWPDPVALLPFRPWNK